MNEQMPGEGTLMAEQAYGRLIALLRGGQLGAGQFVSMPGLVELIGLPLAATREAVKRAEARGLVSVLPKRGVLVMRADPGVIRDCLDLRAILEQEGARRLVELGAALPLAELRESHEALLLAARRDMSPELPAQAIRVDLSLHDALAAGLDNPLVADVYQANRDRIAVIQVARPFLHDRIASAMQEHLAIIDALERRDEGAAVQGIRHHYRQTLRWWGIVV
jgi:DNA-binding GntR family transcriptional regulator